MSDDDLKELETSTTNITDDVKANIQKISSVKSKIPMDSVRKRNKRYSCVFPSEVTNSKKDPMKRRSLNMGAGDGSKIPVGCKINRGIEERTNLHRCNSGIVQNIPKKNDNTSSHTKTKCKPDNSRDGNITYKNPYPSNCNNNSFKNENVHAKSEVKENVPLIETTKSNVPNKSNDNRTSGLPVLIR